MKIKNLIFPFILAASCLSGCSCKHNIVIDQGIEPTCSSIGLSEGSHCDICGQVIKPQEKLDKLEHTVCLKDSHVGLCSNIWTRCSEL